MPTPIPSSIMRPLIGLLLLFLQLRPLIGVGMCLHNAAHEQEKCSMPMSDDGSRTRDPRPTPPSDCAQMAVCAAPVSVVVQAPIHLSLITPNVVPQYSAPATLAPGDVVAPPQPPPIA